MNRAQNGWRISAVITGWLLAVFAFSPAHATASDACRAWSLWQQFKSLYVSADGRVIDASTPARITTSEGQSYAMLFALAANDHASFDLLVRWTENNLAKGSLLTSLPAWEWGHAEDGQWRVMDTNSASDADIWIAYALSEAGRLWRVPRYTQLGNALSEHILRDEAMSVPNLGLALLPGPRGFVDQSIWRFNASYLPIQALRYLSSKNSLWNEALKSSLQIIKASAPHGFASDWIEYRSDAGFAVDRSTQGIGSYDAIRVYLWAGMLNRNDPAFVSLNEWLFAALQSAEKQSRPAERVDTHTLVTQGNGSPGFAAAFFPLRDANTHNSTTARAEVLQHALKDDQAYFSDALTLFGIGAVDGWLRFDERGQFIPKWRASCVAQ